MKEHATRILERVSTLLHRYSVSPKAWVNHLRFWEDEKEDEEHPRFGNKGWQCPECQKWMHQGVKEDHEASHEPDPEEEIEDANTRSTFETESRGDLVDDYNAEWLEEKDEENKIEIQEVDDNQGLKEEQLRKRWEGVIKQLREKGEFVVTKNDYHGTARGADIVRDMKQDFKRLDLDMELEFDVGRKKSTVRRRN